jgi:hypothetical protein
MDSAKPNRAMRDMGLSAASSDREWDSYFGGTAHFFPEYFVSVLRDSCCKISIPWLQLLGCGLMFIVHHFTEHRRQIGINILEATKTFFNINRTPPYHKH